MDNENNLSGVNLTPNETPSTAPVVGENTVSITTPETGATAEVAATPSVDPKPVSEVVPETAPAAPVMDEAFSEPIVNANPIISSGSNVANPAPEAAPVANSTSEVAQTTNPALEAPVFGNQASNPATPAVPAAPVAGKSSHAGLIICIITAIVVIGLGVLVVVLKPWESFMPKTNGDNSGVSGGSSASNSTEPTNTKGSCKFYECLSKLDIDNTPEEVEEVIGFAPETKTENKIEYYTWAFDDEHSIEMSVTTLYNGSKSTLHISLKTYPDSDVEQSGVTFDNVQTIKSNMNVGDGVSYDEFKDYMGGVDGILIELGSTSKKYVWRSNDSKGYINGTFDNDGRCTFMSGITY